MGRSAKHHQWQWTLPLLALVITLGTAACAFHRGGKSSYTSTITEAEIDSIHATSAYDVVKRLRPQYLIPRGRTALDPTQPPALPNVYVDNQLYGDITALIDIAAGTIESIRFYSASEAQYAFGRGNMAGAINILTKH